jgi:hypothetical protein
MRIRIRIQQLKLMRIHADPDPDTDPDPKPWVSGYVVFVLCDWNPRDCVGFSVYKINARQRGWEEAFLLFM